MSLLPIKNAFYEEIAEVIPGGDYGFMLHVLYIWIVWINVETRSTVEGSELIRILEKINVFLDIFYNTLNVPHHSTQSGKKSSVHVNITGPLQADSSTLMQRLPLFFPNSTKVTICHQVFTLHNGVMAWNGSGMKNGKSGDTGSSPGLGRSHMLRSN